MSNELHIGGNSYGPNAVGRGARATQHHVAIGAAVDDQLAGALAALRSLVEEHRDQIPEAARVQKDIDAVEQETADPDPDRDRLRDTLKRIGVRVAAVAPVVSAVNDVRELIERLVP
ncbi:DUF5955 family protein [Actinoplanes sp. NPDC049548]|uniref:DUF5955 family protein n=1 Tax=Actinoplanes sp. NPDC049548 TaxID=3155152 RepID=UPI00342DFAC6